MSELIELEQKHVVVDCALARALLTQILSKTHYLSSFVDLSLNSFSARLVQTQRRQSWVSDLN